MYDFTSGERFAKFFKEQEAEEDSDASNTLRVVKGLTVKQAVALIR
jgi:hypothetical protein